MAGVGREDNCMTKEKVEVNTIEMDDKVEITISQLQPSKVLIQYKPEDYYGRGEFKMEDDGKKIGIERCYSVAGRDGDTDWDFETLYPCDRCDTLRSMVDKRDGIIKKLEAKQDLLFELIGDLKKKEI